MIRFPRSVASVELIPDAAVKPPFTVVPLINGGRVVCEKVTEGVTLIPPGCPR